MPSSHTHHRQQVPTGWGVPTGLVAGAGVGLLLGILLQQLALWLIVGATTGLLAGAAATAVTATPAHRRGAVLAVALTLVVAGLTIALFIILR